MVLFLRNLRLIGVNSLRVRMLALAIDSGSPNRELASDKAARHAPGWAFSVFDDTIGIR